jgi:Undecaprenyl-phosphate glucose phosphotransferase
MNPALTVEPERRSRFRPQILSSGRDRTEAKVVHRLVRLLQSALVVALALIVSVLAHPHGLLLAPLVDILPLALATPVMIMAASATLNQLGAQVEQRRQTRHSWFVRMAGGLLMIGALLTCLIVALPISSPQVEATYIWFGCSAASVMLIHGSWLWRLARWRRLGKLTPNIIIIGATANAERLIARAHETGEVAVLGVFDDRSTGRIPTSVAGVPVLGNVEALLAHPVLPYVDRIVITVPTRARDRIRQFIDRLQFLPNEVSLFLDIDGEVVPSETISSVAQLPVSRLSGHRVDEQRLFAKRVQDLVFGTIACFLAAPAMLAIALAIKMDSQGPIFFHQLRYGFNNEPILVRKFRSMRQEAADPTASRQVARNDSRVTRVGRFIRSTSLDELPQLFNVISGEMSMVGPRPHAIGMKTGDTESARLVAEYAHRHRIKPGITSWAAIHGSRGPVNSTEEIRARVALDIAYIERQSFWLDLYILLKTMPCILGDRQAVR